jgi:hypothetical protein
MTPHRHASFVPVLVMAGLLAGALPAGAQDAAALGEQLAQVRRELAALREELQAVKAALPMVAGAAAAPAVEPPAASVEMLQTQVQELAQSKVESASRFPVRLFGSLVSNTAFNSGEANWIENPNLVGRPADPAGSMTSTVRQTQLGLSVGTIPVGAWAATGEVLVDFLGGVPNFVTGTVMGLPRLLHAWGRVERGGTALQFGQDEVLVAPRNPTSLAAQAFPLFFRAGNLYLRAPQARVEQRLGGGFQVAGALLAPIAGDYTAGYQFAPPPGAGERSRRPAVEGRLGFGRGDDSTSRELAAGVSGYSSWQRAGEARGHGWAAAADLNVRAGRLGAAGELFAADTAEALGAGIAQPGRSHGGWFEGRLAVTRVVGLNAGGAYEAMRDGPGPAGREENRSAFGNVIVRFTPEIAVSVEYRWLQTRYAPGTPRGDNHHVNAVFAFTF